MFLDKLTFIGKSARRHISALSKSLNISDAETAACAYIHFHWETNQERIARALDMDRGNAAKVMLSLENQGIIRRTVNPKNRREYLIELTNEGKQKIDLVINTVSQWENAVLEHLSDYEREVFLEVIDGIFHKLSQNALIDREFDGKRLTNV